MSHSRVLVVVLLFAALLSPATSSQAASSILCSGYTTCERAGYSHAGYETKQKYSYWRMYTGTNCTNYVAYRLVTTNGMPNTRPKSGVGNARDWGVAMASVTDRTPVVGSVAWWGRASGGNHVAYVERVVSSTEIVVSESNYGRPFDWRRITKSGSGWPDGFIHFADKVVTNTRKPAVLSDPVVGASVSASGGAWTPTGNDYRYAWAADGSTISGATGRSYTPTASQLDQRLTVRVTATRTGAPPVSATSEPSAPIARGTLEPESAPTVSGTAKVDSTLTATPGRWTPEHTYTSYQWAADGEDIAGATRSTLDVGPELAGSRLTVRATVSRTAYERSTATSAATPAVAPGTFTGSGAPVVSGTPRVDDALTTSEPRWSRDDVTVSRSWLVDGQVVPGATSTTFTPRPADVGLAVQSRVTATRAGYAPVTMTSAPTTAVAAATFTTRSAPSIRGEARVGTVLTAESAVWSPAAELGHQWYADGVAVAGATGRTFTPGEAQLGKRLHVATWGRRPGYTTASTRSESTAEVEPGELVVVREPSLPGAALLNTPITVDPGEVRPGATLSVQWLRNGVAITGARSTTFTPRSAQLGARLSVRVTHSRTGSDPVVRVLAAPGTVRSASTFTVASRVDGRTAAFSLGVAAAGVPSPTGTVRVTVAGQARTVTLVDGRATLKVSGLPAGSHRAVLAYSGSSRTTAVTSERTLTVR